MLWHLFLFGLILLSISFFSSFFLLVKHTLLHWIFGFPFSPKANDAISTAIFNKNMLTFEAYQCQLELIWQTKLSHRRFSMCAPFWGMVWWWWYRLELYKWCGLCDEHVFGLMCSPSPLCAIPSLWTIRRPVTRHNSILTVNVRMVFCSPTLSLSLPPSISLSPWIPNEVLIGSPIKHSLSLKRMF